MGSGAPVLVLHGTPSPATDWLPLADVLARRYRVLIPDLPGYGRSEAPRDASMEAVGDELAAMLRERGATRLRAVVGYSTGAYRALDLVLRTGITAELVVSLAGVACFDAVARDTRAALARQLAADPSFLASDAVRAIMRELMLSPGWLAAHPADAQRIERWVETTTAPVLARELEALARSRDLRPELPALRSRVYARVGALDRGCPPAWSDELTRLAPRGTLEIVLGCGHALMIEDGPGTVASVARAVDGVS
ncbi:MAG TPA: alpha/beta hydrolase [Kofleriaceae bacterium]|nr:alpha/beta hydrolase [Kofleriaceae bacterium]